MTNNDQERLAALEELDRRVRDYQNKKQTCAHLCGCRRASTMIDSAVLVARDAGWSQKELAERVGVKYQAIQQRETAARKRMLR